jgi:hypothetical protein
MILLYSIHTGWLIFEIDDRQGAAHNMVGVNGKEENMLTNPLNGIKRSRSGFMSGPGQKKKNSTSPFPPWMS